MSFWEGWLAEKEKEGKSGRGGLLVVLLESLEGHYDMMIFLCILRWVDGLSCNKSKNPPFCLYPPLSPPSPSPYYPLVILFFLPPFLHFFLEGGAF